MNKMFVSHSQMDEAIRQRPSAFLDEMKPCFLEYTKEGIWFDADHEAYIGTKKKYANWRKEEKRPVPTLRQAASFLSAATNGKYVSLEIVAERKITCDSCEFQRSDSGIVWCRVCGCKVSSEDKKIDNLASYEENLPRWGCKHPQRNQGKGWKR